ncbi:cytochrome P450 [Gallibacterium anatis]
MGRIVTQNINYKDFIFKKGDRIMFYTGMANFDPNVFKNPFEFSLNRYEKPLSFGSGVHMCIGMGISLSFSSKCVDFICSNYSIKNVSVFELIKGVSSLGAFRFSIEVG